MVAVQTEEIEGTEEAVRVAVNAQRFGVALKNALLFAGKDNLRPILATVKVDFMADKIRLVATDSYRLLVQELEVENGIVGSFLMTRGDAEQLSKAIAAHKPAADGIIAIGFRDHGEQLETSVGFTTTVAIAAPFDFPNWQQLALWDETLTVGTPCAVAGFNAKYLGEICKLKGFDGGRYERLVLDTGTGLSCARFNLDTKHGTIRGGLMPIRK